MEFFTAELVGEKIWAIDGVANDLMHLVEGSERALLVDTGMGVGDLASFVRGLTRLPITVVNTHGHPDHAGGNPGFDEAWLHPADYALKDVVCADNYRLSDISSFYGPSHPNYQAYCDALVHYRPTRLMPLTPGHIFDLGGRRLRVMEVPGHTPGCIGLHCQEEKLFFGGDSLVATPVWLYLEHSLPLAVYLRAIEQLAAIKDDIERIFPGHKPTPLGREMIDDLVACARMAMAQPGIGEPVKTFAGEGLQVKHGQATIIYNPARVEG